MMRRSAAAVVTIAALVGSTSAAADIQPGPPPIAGTLHSTPGGAGHTAGGQGRSAGRPRVRTVRRCRTRHHVRICRYYKGRTLIKTCKKRRGHRPKCHRNRHRRRLATATTAGRRIDLSRLADDSQRSLFALSSQGWANPLMRGVVRTYTYDSPVPDRGDCSGALIAYGLVVTAAHCLYNTGAEDTAHPVGQYRFADGYMQVVPANTVQNGTNTLPYGAWNIAATYYPQGYTQGDITEDFGIIVLAPNSAGEYAGQFTGTYNATWDLAMNTQTRIYHAGYPASGIFRTPAYFYGEGQFYCDGTPDDFPQESNGAVWIRSECAANGGSSGGPIFADGPNGWTIVAAHNRGDNPPQGYSTTHYDLWFDDRWGQFYNAVISILNQGFARVSRHTRSLVSGG